MHPLSGEDLKAKASTCDAAGAVNTSLTLAVARIGVFHPPSTDEMCEENGLMLVDAKPSAISSKKKQDDDAKHQARIELAGVGAASKPGAVAASTVNEPYVSMQMDLDASAKARASRSAENGPAFSTVMSVAMSRSNDVSASVKEEAAAATKTTITGFLGMGPALAPGAVSQHNLGGGANNSKKQAEHSVLQMASPRGGDWIGATTGITGEAPAYSKSTGPPNTNEALERAPDVEFGVHSEDESEESGGLAIAKPVDGEEDAYIQSAIEYDPDQKPALYRRRRFRLYAMLMFVAIMAAALGAIIGVVAANNYKGNTDANLATDVPYRETLGIKERIEGIVGADNINDPENPYAKALTWITHNDSMQLLPDSPNFIQRYALSYFYFATTNKGPWRSCNYAPYEQSASCTISTVTSVDPVSFHNVSSTRWLSSYHECHWAGLLCDEPYGDVYVIDLSGQGLTGGLPEGIKHIPFLQTVQLSHNELTGPLPEGLFQIFKNLFSFQAAGNQLSGPIPDVVWNAPRLARLNLGDNRLNGTISSKISGLQSILGLFLHGNDLTGSLPAEIGSLSNIVYLYLHRNQLSSSIPNEITELKKLEELYLQKNNLVGSLPVEMGKLSSLKQLRLQGNTKFGGDIPDSLYDLDAIRLDFRDCNFTGSLSPRIGKMENLIELRVANNPFLTGPLPSEVKDLAMLEDVQFEATRLTGEIPVEMCNRNFKRLVANCKEGEQDGVSVEAKLKCDCCTICCDPQGNACT